VAVLTLFTLTARPPRSTLFPYTTLFRSYWSMVVADISAALDILRPVHEASDGDDGFVSIELAPDLALETDKSIAAARELHERIRSEEHTSELQSLAYLVCRLLLEKKKKT